LQWLRSAPTADRKDVEAMTSQHSPRALGLLALAEQRRSPVAPSLFVAGGTDRTAGWQPSEPTYFDIAVYSGKANGVGLYRYHRLIQKAFLLGRINYTQAIEELKNFTRLDYMVGTQLRIPPERPWSPGQPLPQEDSSPWSVPAVELGIAVRNIAVSEPGAAASFIGMLPLNYAASS
jgi:hypothetical protein